MAQPGLERHTDKKPFWKRFHPKPRRMSELWRSWVQIPAGPFFVFGLGKIYLSSQALFKMGIEEKFDPSEIAQGMRKHKKDSEYLQEAVMRDDLSLSEQALQMTGTAARVASIKPVKLTYWRNAQELLDAYHERMYQIPAGPFS